jgi:hypothetical protein
MNKFTDKKTADNEVRLYFQVIWRHQIQFGLKTIYLNNEYQKCRKAELEQGWFVFKLYQKSFFDC